MLPGVNTSQQDADSFSYPLPTSLIDPMPQGRIRSQHSTDR